MNITIIHRALITSLQYVSVEAEAAEKLLVLLALKELAFQEDEEWLPAAITETEERAKQDEAWFNERYPTP